MIDSERFDLQFHVDELTRNPERRLAFNADSPDTFFHWQSQLRSIITRVLGLEGRTYSQPVAGEWLSAVKREGYTEEKYAVNVGEGIKAPVYVLVPDGQPPFKPIMVFHGHNPNVQYILGNYPSEEIAQEKRAKQNNYAQALAQAGYLVCAVEQRGFGERKSTQWSDVDRSCRHQAFNYMMAGRTLIGERVWDGMCAIDFLTQRNDIVPNRLGCTGNSGGGTTALWLSALDERITVSVPSCYLCSFYASIGSLRHCECNYVPGILQWAEMGDVAALIAPRPFRAISGERDVIFPIEAARAQFETVKRAYDVLSASAKCSHAVHPDDHRYDHALSHEWFALWL